MFVSIKAQYTLVFLTDSTVHWDQIDDIVR